MVVEWNLTAFFIYTLFHYPWGFMRVLHDRLHILFSSRLGGLHLYTIVFVQSTCCSVVFLFSFWFKIWFGCVRFSVTFELHFVIHTPSLTPFTYVYTFTLLVFHIFIIVIHATLNLGIVAWLHLDICFSLHIYCFLHSEFQSVTLSSKAQFASRCTF